MFRVLLATLALALVSKSAAFAPTTAGRMGTDLASTRGKYAEIRATIAGLDKDNFSSTLTELEPFLTKEAGITFYNKSLRRITTASKALGLEVPAGYALEAKCTAKRREKQAAYAAEQAEAEAAAAAEDAEAPAEEAPAEE
ncbi:MAG: hypothetical protein SGBAC_004181 [Bacillariaceae sp.]